MITKTKTILNLRYWEANKKHVDGGIQISEDGESMFLQIVVTRKSTRRQNSEHSYGHFHCTEKLKSKKHRVFEVENLVISAHTEELKRVISSVRFG